MTEDLASYRSSRGLVSTADPEVDKPIYRKPGFDGKITTLGDMEELISAFLKKTREAQGLSRADIAPMLGLSIPVYGRYERAFSKMTVTRMIHLCEILGFMPIDMIFEAAPHLWGPHIRGSRGLSNIGSDSKKPSERHDARSYSALAANDPR